MLDETRAYVESCSPMPFDFGTGGARAAVDTDQDHHRAHVEAIEAAVRRKTSNWDGGLTAKFLCLYLYECLGRKNYDATKRSKLGTDSYDFLYAQPQSMGCSATATIVGMESMLMMVELLPRLSVVGRSD